MLPTVVGPRPRPNFPEAVIITVMVLLVTLLVIMGMEPVKAVLVVGCAGLFGAAVVQACTTSKLPALLRPTWAELQATTA
ncbi:hypothetical protein [Streptomyces sp. SudanB182_2057]|uniref:hypothetical protein n=1 Tax=Streptomyces sp. SudanB182_2057 TaxID=3035281 RepID=UPI003F55D243